MFLVLTCSLTERCSFVCASVQVSRLCSSRSKREKVSDKRDASEEKKPSDADLAAKANTEAVD